MKLKQLRSWRFSLIFFHRWLGILIGFMFVLWCISGIILMYAGLPHLSAAERLDRLQPLDLSTVAVTPAEALGAAGGTPFRLRVSMHEKRPVYRFNTGEVFGEWEMVYADTGAAVRPQNQDDVIYFLAGRYPEFGETMSYENLLDRPDLYTHSPALQNYFPLHRVAMGDGAGTKFYVSAASGEIVMKTTRKSRLLGFFGYELHTLFFWRQASWWSPLLHWLSWAGLATAVLGLVLGIWRFSAKPVHIKRNVAFRTPYVSWWKWHHYTGLVFGVFMLTWMFSGLVSLTVFPAITESFYGPEQLAAGARTVQGFGPPLDLAPLDVDGLKDAAAAIGARFPLKELELQYHNGEPYWLGYRAPTAAELENWKAGSAVEFMAPNLAQEHLYASVGRKGATRHAAPFETFSEAELLEQAARAMPGREYVELAWLEDYDDYYYAGLTSFDLGLPRPVHTLPVLRLKYADPNATWLYLSPSHGQLLKFETSDRRNRWGYYALHGFDFAALWRQRPLWDVVLLVLLLGALTLSSTTLVPMYERLRRHFLRLVRKLR